MIISSFDNKARKSEQSYHCFVRWTCSHPRHWHSHLLLDEADVVDCLLWQVFGLCHLCDVLLPAFQGLVDDFHLGKVLEVTRKTVDYLSVEFVRHSDFDFLESVKDVKLGQVQRIIAINEMSVSDQWQIQPSTSTRTISGCSVFMSSLSNQFSSCIKKLSWERSFSYSSSVSLCNTDDGLNPTRSNTKSSAYTTNRCGRGSHIRIRSEVDVQKSSIGSFNQDPLTVFDVVVDPTNRLDNHVVLDQDVSELFQLCQLLRLLCLVVERSHPLVFSNKGLPVDQVTHSQTVSLDLGCISRSNSFLGSSQILLDIMSGILFQLILGDQVSAIRQEHSVGIGQLRLIELAQLLEHAFKVHNDSISQKILSIGRNDRARHQVEGILDSIPHDSVASVGATIEPCRDVVPIRQHGHEFSLAFVTPLRAQHHSQSRVQPVYAPLSTHVLSLIGLLCLL